MELYGYSKSVIGDNWSKLTKECYSINCVCSHCTFIPEDLKSECMVKSYVIECFKRFGKPDLKSLEKM